MTEAPHCARGRPDPRAARFPLRRPAPGQPDPTYQERDFLTRVRRLTVEGKRAGEGYWSPGRQSASSSRASASRATRSIRSTCSIWPPATPSASRPASARPPARSSVPAADEIEFASTHADPKSKQLQDDELAFRASGKERRYSWDYDPEMDIYAYSEKTGAMKRLTTARGYDAEGSYSPDGQWIVFSSMRERLRPPAHRRGEEVARPRTRATSPRSTSCAPTAPGQKRLTSTSSATTAGRSSRTDGKQIVWRRFDEQGLIADVWTMNPDGTRSRSRSPSFGSMSWAPYMHPSGEYFIFASNKLGFENFELFMVGRRRGRRNRCA